MPYVVSVPRIVRGASKFVAWLNRNGHSASLSDDRYAGHIDGVHTDDVLTSKILAQLLQQWHQEHAPTADRGGQKPAIAHPSTDVASLNTEEIVQLLRDLRDALQDRRDVLAHIVVVSREEFQDQVSAWEDVPQTAWAEAVEWWYEVREGRDDLQPTGILMAWRNERIS